MSSSGPMSRREFFRWCDALEMFAVNGYCCVPWSTLGEVEEGFWKEVSSRGTSKEDEGED